MLAELRNKLRALLERERSRLGALMAPPARLRRTESLCVGSSASACRLNNEIASKLPALPTGSNSRSSCCCCSCCCHNDANGGGSEARANEDRELLLLWLDDDDSSDRCS